ncbi:hypothetical protein AB0M23_32500 [Streptomyces sp. NPDC052077]|uniref:hypothetical protein n=1 Tax=Streptomyces sp. NPDC052077 TaxID=3154757 RepID=UPI00342A44B1
MAARPRAQRPRIPETSRGQRAARQEWNGGLAGAPRPAVVLRPVEPCPTDGCGALATGPRHIPDAVHVEVPGTGQPARWYCPGRCAAIGRALAEIRGIPPHATGRP